MSRLKLAFRVLFNASFAERVAALPESGAPRLEAVALADSNASPAPAAPPKPIEKLKPIEKPKPVRSEAVTLLETLQREARLIDFLKEPIDAYQDAQIGAAVRDIHRDSGKVIERVFAIRPVLDQSEGSRVELSDNLVAGQIRLTGNVTAERAANGRLVHHGWTVTKCELPEWSGSAESARVVAAAEIEVD